MNPLFSISYFLASFQSLIDGEQGDKGVGIRNSSGRISNLKVDENGVDDNTGDSA